MPGSYLHSIGGVPPSMEDSWYLRIPISRVDGTVHSVKGKTTGNKADFSIFSVKASPVLQLLHAVLHADSNFLSANEAEKDEIRRLKYRLSFWRFAVDSIWPNIICRVRIPSAQEQAF